MLETAGFRRTWPRHCYVSGTELDSEFSVFGGFPLPHTSSNGPKAPNFSSLTQLVMLKVKNLQIHREIKERFHFNKSINNKNLVGLKSTLKVLGAATIKVGRKSFVFLCLHCTKGVHYIHVSEAWSVSSFSFS